MDKQKATSIITALRKGTPPKEGINLYSIGREGLISYFKDKLNEIKEGDSDIKFISGDWGHGKSHFLNLLKDLAIEEGFVVSKVELRSGEVSFDQLEVVVQHIMANIYTKRKSKNGLENLLDHWSDLQKGKREQDIYEFLKDHDIYPDMRMKLVEYQRYHNNETGPQYERCQQVLKWFEGSETKTKTFKSVPQYLCNFTLFVRSLDYAGFVLLLDEAEAITSLTRINRRDLANENIRQVIDNDEETECYFVVFASTSTFLSGENERGAQNYQALWRRIRDPFSEFGSGSLEKVIVDLPELTEEQFFQLATSIKRIYESYHGQYLQEVSDHHLRSLAKYVQTMTDKRVGTMVRSTVAILDVAKKPGFDFSAQFELIVEKIREQEAIVYSQ